MDDDDQRAASLASLLQRKTDRLIASDDVLRAGAFGVVAFELDADGIPSRVAVTVLRPPEWDIELWRSALAGADELIRAVEDDGGRLMMTFSRGDDD